MIVARLKNAHDIAEDVGVSLESRFGLQLSLIGMVLLVAAGFLAYRTRASREAVARRRFTIAGFLGPAVLLVLVFFFAPVFVLFLLSLTDLRGSNFSQSWTFIGFDNYRTVYEDPFRNRILVNTFRYVTLTLAFNIFMGLAIAILTSFVRKTAGVAARALWLLPRITPPVKDVTLDVSDGEFVALLGPSGCGKTTTLLMVAGIYRPSLGEIYFDEHPVSHLPPKDRSLGMVFQSYALYPHMTVQQNISYPLKLQKVPSHKIRVEVQRIAELLGIGELLKRKPGELSGPARLCGIEGCWHRLGSLCHEEAAGFEVGGVGEAVGASAQHLEEVVDAFDAAVGGPVAVVRGEDLV